MAKVAKPSPFWKLPAELRLQIWELSLPVGRLLKVHVDDKRSKAYLVGRLPLPSLLHVCRDSRCFALTVFRRGFQNTPESRNNFYWSPKLDTIWIDHTDVFVHGGYRFLQNLFPVEDMEKLSSTIPDPSDIGYMLPGVQNLAMQSSQLLEYDSSHRSQEFRAWMRLFLQRFSGLKTLAFLYYRRWSKFKHTTENP
jgi:hypothetical protein